MKENQPSRTAPHGDLDTSSNSSLLSLSLSRGSPLSRLSYQPRAPSPLHTEPPVSPIHGATPVRIPSTRTTTATTTRTVQRHDTSNNNNPALSADDGDSYNSTCSSNEYSNSDNNPYPPFMQSSFQRTGNTHNELSHKRRSSIIGNNHTSEQQQQRNAFLKYNEIRRTAQLSINTESPSSSSGGLDKDDDADENGQPVSPIVHDEDDDSLVFKMSELGLYEHK
ncbi:hypothetical protein BDC45DRAFT_67265 [Circinella umbellata]|nr:hypothetical protein BDC45DRAFT_67265 [Circinella umbellata]